MANETPKTPDIGAALAALAEGQKAQAESMKAMADALSGLGGQKAQAESMKAMADALSGLGSTIASGITKGRNDANRPDLAKLRKHQPLAPEHRGEKTYVVGPKGHVRGDRIYKQGELVTVIDERPAVDWVLADSGAVEKKIAAKSAKASSNPAVRAADRG